VPICEEEEIQLDKQRSEANKNMQCVAQYDKKRFDKGKAKVVKFSEGDYVLIKSSERQQTKLDPKFRGPLVVKSITCKRQHKYSHENLRRMPDGQTVKTNEALVETKVALVERNTGETDR